MLRCLPLLIALVALSSCAGEVPWVNPNLSRKFAEHDYAECRHYADSQTGSGYGGGYFDDDRASRPMSGADREVTHDQIAGIIDACMRGKGYFPKR
jgi:hypothetical protein